MLYILMINYLTQEIHFSINLERQLIPVFDKNAIFSCQRSKFGLSTQNNCVRQTKGRDPSNIEESKVNMQGRFFSKIVCCHYDGF